MTHRIVRIIALLCLAATLLTGCAKEEDPERGDMGSEIWEEMPALTFGKLESEKLEVLEWNSGRCEATTQNGMAETSKGYYYVRSGFLYYADKSNLSTWVKGCNKPDCEHGFTTGCRSEIKNNECVIKDGRIYFSPYSLDHPELYTGNDEGRLLVSMAPDGTDWRLEYVIEEAMTTTPASSMACVTSEHWLSMICEMNPDGSYTTQIFRLTDVGEQVLFKGSHTDLPVSFFPSAQQLLFGLNGDRVLFCKLLGEIPDKAFKIVEGEFQEVDLTGLPLWGAYLSGNMLRCFRPNDGYYDIDLTTGEEVFLAPARIDDSVGQVVLPNCIVESTLLYSDSAEEIRTDGMQHAMELFDGEAWHTVTLPEELVNADKSVTISLLCVTSDSVMFISAGVNPEKISFYCIPLGENTYVMEYCGMHEF